MGLKHTVIRFSAFVSLAGTLFGHEGHGHPATQSGLLHYIVNPSHCVPMACVLIATACLVQACRSGRQGRFARSASRKIG